MWKPVLPLWEDLKSEALVRALETWNPDREASFRTWEYYQLLGAMKEAIRRARRELRWVPEGPDDQEPALVGGEDPLDLLCEQEEREEEAARAEALRPALMAALELLGYSGVPEEVSPGLVGTLRSILRDMGFDCPEPAGQLAFA